MKNTSSATPSGFAPGRIFYVLLFIIPSLLCSVVANEESARNDSDFYEEIVGFVGDRLQVAQTNSLKAISETDTMAPVRSFGLPDFPPTLEAVIGQNLGITKNVHYLHVVIAPDLESAKAKRKVWEISKPKPLRSDSSITITTRLVVVTSPNLIVVPKIAYTVDEQPNEERQAFISFVRTATLAFAGVGPLPSTLNRANLPIAPKAIIQIFEHKASIPFIRATFNSEVQVAIFPQKPEGKDFLLEIKTKQRDLERKFSRSVPGNMSQNEAELRIAHLKYLNAQDAAYEKIKGRLGTRLAKQALSIESPTSTLTMKPERRWSFGLAYALDDVEKIKISNDPLGVSVESTEEPTPIFLAANYHIPGAQFEITDDIGGRIRLLGGMRIDSDDFEFEPLIGLSVGVKLWEMPLAGWYGVTHFDDGRGSHTKGVGGIAIDFRF